MMPASERQAKASVTERIYRWVDSRFAVNDLVEYMSHKSVPVHGHSIFYYLGGLTLFLFMVQVGTGILLLMYYRPGSESAYESVQFIVSQVSFGWLIRSLHSWSANLMIFVAFLHMFTVYFTQAYRKPRELTWFTGIALLGLALGFGFSGYLLPWNELSFFATRVGTDMVRAVPIVGDYLMQVLRGGDNVTGATIGRFFGLHVAILPALFTVVLAAHLLFVQRQGMSEPISWATMKPEEKKSIRFFPNFLYRDLLLWLIALNVLALLAVFFPDGIGVVHWPLGQKADPFSPPPPVIRPEWYFMFAFQSLKFLPPHVFFLEGELFGMIVFSIAGLAWMLVPLLDRNSNLNRRSPLFTWLGVGVVTFIVVMTVLGYTLK
ncbi:cytochrome bc complex cytochrome b subunit [candidate division GN15 bacterium]|uniref:Cytochrome bc complex cytochrome b subunit n=1 Tax=candidate division GN15 bacterium TaxID=2072418 RepID=A0A855X0A9_9BACT|nr:MAG: cytochrome bc complex cytochrome b subunit [candidate division GN15 bacterium]